MGGKAGRGCLVGGCDGDVCAGEEVVQVDFLDAGGVIAEGFAGPEGVVEVVAAGFELGCEGAVEDEGAAGLEEGVEG